MAERPIFVPTPGEAGLVKEVYLPLHWHPGFAVTQKQKNVEALHAAAAAAGFSPVLEVSTKSTATLGQHLSAFHLKVRSQSGDIPLESAFQGSKVFERGGPFVDLYLVEPKAAKRDLRLQTSGRLVGFNFLDVRFPLEPQTAFYDWLYLNTIYPHREWLTRLYRYSSFSDIEFNPERSINCQARSCALFVALMSKGLLEGALESPEKFLSTLAAHEYYPRHGERNGQRTLVPHKINRERDDNSPLAARTPLPRRPREAGRKGHRRSG